MSNTGDLLSSPIRQQHGKHHSSDDNEITWSSESVSHSLREDDSHSETSSDSTEGNSRSADNNSPYSQFSDDLSEDQGIEPEDWQSKSRKRKLPTAVACFSSVCYDVTDANQQSTQRTVRSSATMLSPNGQSVDINVHLDTGGSQNLASEHFLLHNIKQAEFTAMTRYTWSPRHMIALAN